MKLSTLTKLTFASFVLASVANVGFAKTQPMKDYKDYKDVAPACPSLMDGFYVGAEVGYDAYRVHNSITGNGLTYSGAGSITGWVGGLFVGYGQYFDNYFYLAGELLGNYNGSSQSSSFADNDGDAFYSKVQVKGTWGLSLLPGIKLNDATLGYLRLGYDWTNFQANGNVTSGTTGVTTAGSKSNTQGGFDFGVGVETLLCANWSLRTEYNHVWYNSFSVNGGVAPANVSDNVNLSDNQFMLGIVYHFA